MRDPVIWPVIRRKKYVIRVIRYLKEFFISSILKYLQFTRITHYLQRITGRVTRITRR